jgi:glyoxylase-like metal-dependent hydrolase (beta-lactamase superfamily II)
MSHGHGDHTANANDFAGSTWLVNKAERDVMFAETVPRFYTAATYSALKTSKTKFIDGDYDVFGDGTVVIKQTPGHTPGHQVLALNLAKTGTVVMTGDLYH